MHNFYILNKKKGTVFFFWPIRYTFSKNSVERLDGKKKGRVLFSSQLDGFKAGQLRHMCEKPVGWFEKKRDSVFFLACWMDWRLARFDICVKTPVGWLDDQKKRDILFRNRPLDRWMVKKKREGIFFLTCWMESRLVNSGIWVEKPVG